MEQSFAGKIELLLGEYFEYRKAQESHSAHKDFDEDADDYKWLPKPLEEKTSVLIDLTAEIQPIILEQSFDYEEVIALESVNDSKYASALSDSVVKKIYPFTADEVAKMDYEGSPIFSDLDKETLALMTISAYNNAVTEVPELGDLEAEGERAYFTKAQIFKSLIRELILKDIFFIRYNKNYW